MSQLVVYFLRRFLDRMSSIWHQICPQSANIRNSPASICKTAKTRMSTKSFLLASFLSHLAAVHITHFKAFIGNYRAIKMFQGRVTGIAALVTTIQNLLQLAIGVLHHLNTQRLAAI